MKDHESELWVYNKDNQKYSRATNIAVIIFVCVLVAAPIVTGVAWITVYVLRQAP